MHGFVVVSRHGGYGPIEARSKMRGLPGVYLLAHFESSPRTVDPKDERIIYVGIAGKKDYDKKSLKERWKQFHQAAFGNNAGNGPHSGGNTYARTFNPDRAERKAQELSGKLYVSALAIAREPPWYSAFILAAERLLIWEYALRHHSRPKCNKE